MASSAPPNQGPVQGPVEARSLSSIITTIASNPPAYPRNPAQQKLEPLVLYIVRVPGSKDVFLTPLKPPTKSSISVESINASFYYLHVATPDDEALLREIELEREEKARQRQEALKESDLVAPAGEFARLNNVRRKPVASTTATASASASSVSTSHLQRPPVPPHQFSTENVPFEASGFPFRQRIPAQTETDEPHKPALPRRPLPSLPSHEGTVLDFPDSGQSAKKTKRWSALSNRGLESWKEKYEALASGRRSLDSGRPQLRPHSSHGTPSGGREWSPARSPGHSPSRSPYESKTGSSGFQITLIRRDPTHGSQWNVATISTLAADPGTIDIEIATPGYNRFTANDEPVSLASLGIVNLPSGKHMPTPSFRPPPPFPPPPPPPGGSAEQASSPNDPFKPKRFHRKLCVSRPPDDTWRKNAFDMPSRALTDTGSGSSSPTKHGPGFSKLKSGYYTFTSPWNGICTFATSVNGRSLKCKHMIPIPGHTPSNNNGGANENPAVTVAEIRFNTPFQASNLYQQSHHHSHHQSPFTLSQIQSNIRDSIGGMAGGGGGAATDGKSKRSSLAVLLNPNTYHNNNNRTRSHSGASAHSATSRRLSNSSSTESDVDGDAEEDRLDLSLGRENAGGGLRGKSAKLGKLIIEDEGIKMLDLVVASCMAIWWKGYYC